MTHVIGTGQAWWMKCALALITVVSFSLASQLAHAQNATASGDATPHYRGEAKPNSEKFDAGARANSEKFDAEARANSEKFDAEARANSEKFDAEARANSEQFNAEARANSEKFDAVARVKSKRIAEEASRSFGDSSLAGSISISNSGTALGGGQQLVVPTSGFSYVGNLTPGSATATAESRFETYAEAAKGLTVPILGLGYRTGVDSGESQLNFPLNSILFGDNGNTYCYGWNLGVSAMFCLPEEGESYVKVGAYAPVEGNKYISAAGYQGGARFYGGK